MRLKYILSFIVLLFLSLIINAQIDKFEHEFEYLKSQDPKGVQILLPGQYHGEEVNEGVENLIWFALLETESSHKAGAIRSKIHYIEKVEISVKKFHDKVMDKGDEKTGKEIKVIGYHKNIILLVTGIDSLSEDLEILPNNKSRGKVADIELNIGKTYPPNSFAADDVLILDAYGCVTENDNPSINSKSITNYYLTAKRYNRTTKEYVRQVLGGTAGFNKEGADHYHLFWVGDLDEDGKMDLLLNMSRHYNVSNLTLFLSSMAKDGELLHMATQLNSTGC